MRALPALAVLLALAVTGCGGDSDDDADGADTPAASASTTPPGDSGAGSGSCTFLTVDDVSAATDSDAELVAGGPTGCTFRAGKATVLLNFVPIQIDVEEYATGTRDACETPVTDVEAGDIAFACVGISPQGFVFFGSDSAVIDVTGSESDQVGLDVAVALLPQVQFPTDNE